MNTKYYLVFTSSVDHVLMYTMKLPSEVDKLCQIGNNEIFHPR